MYIHLYAIINVEWYCIYCLQELCNPILYLDIMRWAWQQDYHDRPTSSQLESVLSLPAVPHLVDAYSLEDNCYQNVMTHTHTLMHLMYIVDYASLYYNSTEFCIEFSLLLSLYAFITLKQLCIIQVQVCTYALLMYCALLDVYCTHTILLYCWWNDFKWFCEIFS